MAKILITGANGFIAKRLAYKIFQDAAFKAFDTLVIQSRRPVECREALAALNPEKKLESYSFDLCGRNIENNLPADFDIVFHLAAAASFPGNKESYDNNVQGTKMLLKHLVANSSKSLKKIIFCSSMGAVDRSPYDKCENPIDGSEGEFPQSIYGKSKLECERLVKTSGLPYSIVRPSMVYGPGMRENSHVRVLLSNLLKRSLLSRIYFPGKVSIIHVDDLCRLFILLINEKTEPSMPVFAAHETPLAIGEVNKIAAKYSLSNTRLYEFPRTLTRIFKAVAYYAPFKFKSLFYDALTVETKTAESLGFKCEVPHESGILELLHWHSREKTGLNDGWTVVTGAAGGIGRELSFQLYARGCKLLMIDKDAIGWPEHLSGKNAAALRVDLRKQGEIEDMLKIVSTKYSPVSLLINCAGIGHRGQFENDSCESSRDIIDLNIKAMQELSHFAIQNFKMHGNKGTLINIASSAAFQPLPYMATYAASKSYVLYFTAAIKEELRQYSGIKVICVCPGGVDTSFQEKAGVKSNKWERLQTAQAVAYIIAETLRRENNFPVILGIKAKAMYYLGRILGLKFSSRLWGRLMNSLR